jgi:hypothetical protein
LEVLVGNKLPIEVDVAARRDTVGLEKVMHALFWLEAELMTVHPRHGELAPIEVLKVL